MEIHAIASPITANTPDTTIVRSNPRPIWAIAPPLMPAMRGRAAADMSSAIPATAVLTPAATPLAVFYFASYAVYNGALGLLLGEPDALSAETSTAPPLWRSLLAGAVAWGCFVAWGLAVT